MTRPRGERLYHRLPEIHRRRDREQGEPLRALLSTFESQLEVLEDDIAGLYENWFLDTCQEWVVPYFADLLGVRGLGQPPHAGVHPRVQVARALEYRRRKGTPVALERTIRDVTGWSARAVEMFEHLAHTQNAGHPRPELPRPGQPWLGKGGLFDVQQTAGVGREDDPFAPPALFHTVDVRRISAGRGRYNIPDIALHVWRLQAFPIADSPAADAEGVAGGFFFDPLGRDLRLFNRPQTPKDVVRHSGEHQLPVPLRRESVAAHLADYYGADLAFEVCVAGDPVPAASLDFEELADGSGQWPAAPAPAGRVQVDPESGRIRFGTPPTGEVRVSYLYGFAAALGGGPYDRRATLAVPTDDDFYRKVSTRAGKGGIPLDQALGEWAASTQPRGIIRVLDNEIYGDDQDFQDLEIVLDAGRSLVLEAAECARPVLRPDTLRVTGTGAGRSFTLNGFLVDAGIGVSGSLELLVTHCTLVPRPGRPNVFHTGGDARDLKARLTFSITGPLHLPDDIAELRIEDGILDAANTGGGATPLPALVSGPLNDPPDLGVHMELSVQLGTAAPRAVTLAGVPANVPTAAELLQTAIRAAEGDPSDAYTGAVVAVVGDRLLVRSGTAGEEVAVFSAASDPQTARDLALLVPAARLLRGVLSGDLASFPVFAPPQVRVTLGGDGPHVAAFSGSPGTLAEAAAQLQAAIRSARPQTVFTQATVTVLGNQLLVRPGIAGAGVAFAASSADPQTAADLKLLSPPAERADGVFSGRLDPFPVFPGPEVSVTIGGTTSVARLPGVSSPGLAALADALENALQDAHPAAEVLVVGDRLLVRHATAGSAITFAATATDTATVAALALAAPPAERLDSLRLSTSLAPFPAFPLPHLRVEIDGDGHVVEMRRLATDLSTARTVLQEAVRTASGSAGFAGAEVLLLGDRLLVRSDDAAVEVQADGTDSTAAALAFTSALAGEPQGLLSGEIGTLPAFLLPSLNVSFDGEAAKPVQLTGFPRSVGEARTLIEAALRAAAKETAFTKAMVVAAGDRLFIASGVPSEETVEITASSADLRTAADLALERPAATDATGRLSGELVPFPILFRPTLQATIGSNGPRKAELANVPTDAATAGPLLQAALRAAHTNQRFANATVTVLGNRLLVQPGTSGEAVSFAAGDGAGSVESLGLLPSLTRTVQGLLSGDLSTFAGLPQPRLRVTLTDGGADNGPHLASLPGFPADLDEAKTLLETALRSADSSPAFTGASVVRLGDRLLVQPGVEGAVVTVSSVTAAAGVPADTTTVAGLGLGPTQAQHLLFSGDLSTFPALTATAPAVSATLAGVGPRTVTFATVPATLAEAATALEAALRATTPADDAFSAATVQVSGDRLRVQAGTAGSVVFAAAAGDSTTAAELQLTPGSGALAGLSSGDLTAFAGLAAGKVQVSFGGGAKVPVRLAAVPGTLAEAASELQAAIRAASSGAAFTGATVEAFGTRLLVTPGTAGAAVDFDNPVPGAGTATLLGLIKSPSGAKDVQGLLSGPVSAVVPPPLAVEARFGGDPHTVDLGAVPTGIANLAELLQDALRNVPSPSASFSGAQVSVTGNRILVLSGTAGESVAFEKASASPEVVAQLKLDGASTEIHGLLSGPLDPFPVLRMEPAVTVTLGSASPLRVVLGTPANLEQVALLLEAGLRRAAGDAGDAGAARPASFTGARVRLLGGRLLVTSGNPVETVKIEDTDGGPATASGLSLTSGSAAAAAGWLAGPPFPLLRAASPQVKATFGGTAATVSLAQPADVSNARGRLQSALATAFPGARVELFDERRLLVLSAAGTQAVSFEATAADPYTAVQLGLSASATPRAVTGLLSGSLASFPAVSANAAIALTLGTDGPHLVPFQAPGSLAEARSLLEAAIRQAQPGRSFVGARVLVTGDSRLLVLPGVAGEAVAIADGTGRTTAAELLLTPAAGAVAAKGWLGSDPAAFPGLTAHIPRLDATLSGVTRTVALADIPGTLSDARRLLLSALDSFSGATVEVLADRLLVRSGTSSAFSFANTGGTQTAELLGLAPGESGLLSGSLAGFTGLADERPAVGVTLGGRGPFRATLGASPTDVAQAASRLEAALHAADGSATFANAKVAAVGDRLHITPGNPQDAIAFSPAAGREGDLARLRLDAASLLAAGGLLSGPHAGGLALRGLPKLQMRIQNGASNTPHALTLSGYPTDLGNAKSLLKAALLGLLDTSTPPKKRFPQAEVEVLDGRRLLVSPGAEGTVSFEAAPTDAVSVGRLRLDAGQAVPANGLLSGRLSPFPSFLSGPSVLVQIGTEGPYRATLPALPASLEDARWRLEEAIRKAHTSPAFYLARVVLTPDRRRLVVLPGRAGQVVFSAPPDDEGTVAGLRLQGSGSLQVGVLLSSLLEPPVELTAVKLGLHMALRSATEPAVDFEVSPVRPAETAGVAGLATALADAIDAASPSSTAWVIQVGDDTPEAVSRLVVVPKQDGYSVGLSATSDDPTTVGELGFEVGSTLGGSTDDEAGPPLSLERVTVLGRVTVRELREASAVLFSQPLRVQRRHAGCVRYSYLPDGSETPRRFRCQPDLALTLAVRQALEQRAREAGVASVQQLPPAERSAIETRERVRVLAHLAPRFASTRFGDPGYAHLLPTNAPEILTGAEDGSEIGAFNHLQEPARRRQLAILLEEYLRFGLDAGIFYVTESTE